MSANHGCRTLAGAALIGALLGAPVALADDGPRAPVPMADYVRFVVAGRELSGWPLDPTAEGGCALLVEGGAIEVIADQPPPELKEHTARPVTEIPSPGLVAGLAHVDAGVRDRCEELLVDQGAVALPHLGAALDDRSAEACRRALRILVDQAAKFPKPAHAWLSRVRANLGADDELVREMALRAYAALGEEDVRERCEDALFRDASIHVRHEAIVQLGRKGDLRAVDAILKHLEECGERSLRLVSFDALRRLTGRRFGRNEEQWRNWWSNHREELLPPSGG